MTTNRHGGIEITVNSAEAAIATIQQVAPANYKAEDAGLLNSKADDRIIHYNSADSKITYCEVYETGEIDRINLFDINDDYAVTLHIDASAGKITEAEISAICTALKIEAPAANTESEIPSTDEEAANTESEISASTDEDDIELIEVINPATFDPAPEDTLLKIRGCVFTHSEYTWRDITEYLEKIEACDSGADIIQVDCTDEALIEEFTDDCTPSNYAVTFEGRLLTSTLKLIKAKVASFDNPAGENFRYNPNFAVLKYDAEPFDRTPEPPQAGGGDNKPRFEVTHHDDSGKPIESTTFSNFEDAARHMYWHYKTNVKITFRAGNYSNTVYEILCNGDTVADEFYYDEYNQLENWIWHNPPADFHAEPEPIATYTVRTYGYNANFANDPLYPNGSKDFDNLSDAVQFALDDKRTRGGNKNFGGSVIVRDFDSDGICGVVDEMNITPDGELETYSAEAKQILQALTNDTPPISDSETQTAIEKLQDERFWTGVIIRNMQNELSERHTKEQYAYLRERIAAEQPHLEDVDARIASQLSYEATIAVYENGNETDDVITYTANFATIEDARKFVAGESVETGEIDIWNVDQNKRLGTTLSAPYNGGVYYAGYTIRHNCEIVEYDDEAGFIA